MKIRRFAAATLIVAASLVVLGTSVVAVRQVQHLTVASEESQFELMRSIIQFNLEGAEGRALARAEMLAVMPVTRAALGARDRDKLMSEFKDMFQTQKDKHGVDQTAFHVPPAQAFLRLQAPDLFGDDLTKFRPLVVAANRDKQPLRGLAIARTGPAIFGISPVKDPAGNHAGTVEFGIAFGGVLDKLKEAYGLELALFVEEEPLRQYAQGLNSTAFDEQNRVGKYMKFHATNWELLRKLTTAQDLAAVEGIPRYVRDAGDDPYGVLLVPLRNASGNPFGVLAVARPFGDSRAAAGRFLVWQGAFALFGIVLFVGVVLVVVRGFLLRPLAAVNRAFTALASGDSETRIADSETWCEELQSLAQTHETLRVGSRQGDVP